MKNRKLAEVLPRFVEHELAKLRPAREPVGAVIPRVLADIQASRERQLEKRRRRAELKR